MEKNRSTGKTVAIIILIVLLLGAVSYIGYDKFLVNEKSVSSNEKKSENSKEVELDIDSRLVKSLYNKVSTGESSKEEANCNYNYMYGYDYDSNSYKDFYVDKATEEQKMEILSLQLNREGAGLLFCGDGLSIPDKMNDYPSKCIYDKIVNKNENSFEYYYNKKDIETLYKDLYGKDAKLDTSKPIYVTPYRAYAYMYIDSLDKYMQYVIDTGGVCGPTGMYGTITKAIKTADSIKIYEKVTIIDGEKNTTTNQNYIYTFKLDSDGMYNYVSRVKES